MSKETPLSPNRLTDPKADYGPLLKLFLEDVTQRMCDELMSKAKPILYKKAQEAVRELEANLIQHYNIQANQICVALCVKDGDGLKKVEAMA